MRSSETKSINVTGEEKSIGRKKALSNIVKGAALLFPLAISAQNVFANEPVEDTDRINDALNVFLRASHLINELYSLGLSKQGLIPSGKHRDVFLNIKGDIEGQIRFINETITSKGGSPEEPDEYDLTGAKGDATKEGQFKDVFTDYKVFLELSQVIEDVASASFKSQVGNFKTDRSVMVAAHNIHSVHARHSAIIRVFRKEQGVHVRPWITKGDEQQVEKSLKKVYVNESDIEQIGINTLGLGLGYSREILSEAFDEDYGTAQVVEFVKMFRVV